MTIQQVQSESCSCWTAEVYCPICGEWIAVEVYDDEHRIFYHVDDVVHTGDDYLALEFGIN